MFWKRKAYHFLIGLFFITILPVSGQDQKVADSLKRIQYLEILDDSSKLELLRNIAFNETRDLNLAVQYAEKLITFSSRLENNLYLYRGYFQKGNKRRIQGNLEEALDAYFKSVVAARNAEYVTGEGSAYGAIADIYSVSNNHPNAMLYYHKAISTLRKSNDSVSLAAAILNAGDEFLINKIYDSALLHFKEAGLIAEEVNYLTIKAYSLGNIGMVFANSGQSALAEKNINEAIQLLKELEDYYPICVYLISMCDIYLEKDDERKALNYALRSLELAQQYGLKEQISDANLKLSELYGKARNQGVAFRYYKDHIAYRDSVNNIESVQKIADLRTNFEVSQKQVEVDLLNQQKRNQKIMVIASIITSLLIFLLALGLYRRYRFVKKINIIIEAEKNRSENLLLNILPKEVADELKAKGESLARNYDEVTVLFTDFKDFTRIAEKLKPLELVAEINTCFKYFDEIVTKHGIEKIKTIGDSYMAVGGLSSNSSQSALETIIAAIEMQEFMLARAEKLSKQGMHYFEMRAGIHTGPVVAGIVGVKKFQYDIWGDTVNTASRMEGNGEVGKVNVSQHTYELVMENPEFTFQSRGKVEAKGLGPIEMYFVNRRNLL